jgi:hypothetical protein
VYRTASGDIEELSLLTPHQGWHAADLTALTDAPAAASPPFGFATSLTGQDPAARVVYRTVGGDIEELASSGGSWSAVDLTALTGAPAAASSPSGYTTSLTGQGPAARVVYRTAGGDIEELALTSGGSWQANDLTALTGAPIAANTPFAPFGFATSLTGQNPAARVVYRTAGRHIEELALPSGGSWSAVDLTALTGAPTALGAPFGFTTSLTGQDPAARIVYRTARQSHIEELASSGGSWSAVDLTALTGAPSAVGIAFGYTTTLTDQGPTARVVYRTVGRHIVELALPSGGSWQADDLTAVSGAPDAASAPFGYTTTLTGQVPAARVVYRAAGRDIEELSAG